MDNIHLGTVVYQLAKNNIKILQAIADAQAASLNVMSGIAASNDLADIAAVGDAQVTALSPEPGSAPATGSLQPPVQPRTLSGEVAQADWQTRSSESALLLALTLVIDRCR